MKRLAVLIIVLVLLTGCSEPTVYELKCVEVIKVDTKSATKVITVKVNEAPLALRTTYRIADAMHVGQLIDVTYSERFYIVTLNVSQDCSH